MSDSDRPLVADPHVVATITAAIARSALAAFDLEFLAQDRLVPTLCLVQVAWLTDHDLLDAPARQIVAAKPEVALVDPLAVDVGPLIAALAAHPRIVAHAPRQDLGLLATRFRVALPQLADTQVMAAFAGLGDQIGFATLANQLLGTTLGKEQQWTNWARRPLSDAQLTYAEADVVHLPALYALLRERLGPRMPWALAESAEISASAIAASGVTPETAWEHVGGLRSIDTAGLAAAIELAAWRQRTAVALDKPIGQVLSEQALVEIARARPDSASAIRSLRNASPIAKQLADEIVSALASARPSNVPPRAPSKGAPSPRAQRWGELLFAIAQLVAERTGVASRLLATRSDADTFARAIDEFGLAAGEQLPALATWRRAVLGNAWMDWLTGKIALVGDARASTGLALVPVSS